MMGCLAVVFYGGVLSFLFFFNKQGSKVQQRYTKQTMHQYHHQNTTTL